MKRWLVLILALAVLMSGSALAQGGVRIEVDPNDTPLNIVGWLDEANSFTGNLRLTARGGNVTAFTFLPSDLKREGSDEVIGRQNVTLVGDAALTADVPKDFQVTVSGLKLPGTYQGKIEILLPGQNRSDAVTINLKVTAKARPALTPLAGTDQIRLKLVNCSLDCWLAQMLLPASTLLNQWQLQFDNAVQANVNVLDNQVILRGERTGYQLTQSALALPQSQQSIPAGKGGALPLTLNRSNMPPDHYTGSIYLTLEGRPERLILPVDLNVRGGPFWPLVLLLMGIVLGRLVKYMQERGKPLASGLEAVNKLQALINKAPAQDQQVVAPMLDAVRQLVYREKLENLQPALSAIEGRLDTLQKLRTIEASLKGKEQHPIANKVLDKISQIRQLLAQEQDDKVNALMTEVKGLLAELITTSLMGPDNKPDPAIVRAKEEADQVKVTTPPGLPPILPIGKWLKGFQDALIFLSGLSDEIRAEATLWLVRPLLYLVLLVGLLAVGIGTLYVDNGLTFGANPLADYMGLILWGLSADVASRTLSNLQGSRA
jgi:hypothetical protein